MAIKGKRKGKSRPRSVATAPRPFLVAPRTPPLRRRPVQVFLILFVLAGFVALGAGLRSAQNEAERTADIQEFAARIDAEFARSGIVQQFGGPPIVLPEIQAAFVDLERRKLDPAKVREDAEGWRESSTVLADAVGTIGAESVELKQARELMRGALELYASVAGQIGSAAQLDADSRQSLVGSLQEQLDLARSFFEIGWGMLSTERDRAGIPAVQQPLVPGGVPPP